MVGHWRRGVHLEREEQGGDQRLALRVGQMCIICFEHVELTAKGMGWQAALALGTRNVPGIISKQYVGLLALPYPTNKPLAYSADTGH